MNDTTFTAYYDLKNAPVTFDFAQFLVSAAAYAHTRKESRFDLVILADGFRNVTNRERGYSMVERHWRLWNLIVEFVKIVPQVRNLSIVRTALGERAANAYPPNYHPLCDTRIPYSFLTVRAFHERGADVRVLRPSEYALRAAGRLLGTAKTVTLTLRKATFDPARNSQIEEWLKFSQLLTERGYQVVVIPDQDDALGDATLAALAWRVLDVAAMNMDLRLAIYSRATMNYVANGGMVCVFLYSKVPFVWCPVMVERSFVATQQYYRNQGIEAGQKFPWLGERQTMIWQADTLETLTASLPATGL